MQHRLLVFGGAGSVGRAVCKVALDTGKFEVVTAGLQEAETMECDMQNVARVAEVVRTVNPHSIVVATGLNLPVVLDGMTLNHKAREQMDVNCWGPLIALQTWLKMWQRSIKLEEEPAHYVLVGSNSAMIPRTLSLGYCVSKAAADMMIRVAAREAVKGGFGGTIWGVHPGWIEDSEMSRGLRRLFKDSPGPLHRIPGQRTLNCMDVATTIMSGIVNDKHYLNGCMLRLDGGEI